MSALKYLHTIKFEENATNIFIIRDEEEAALIDAHIGQEAAMIKTSIDELAGSNKLKQVILTHYHLDHVGACPLLEEKSKRFRLGKDESPYLEIT